MGSTVHVYPTKDLVEHDTEHGTECVCGPAAEFVPSETGDGWLITHHSLDGREHRE